MKKVLKIMLPVAAVVLIYLIYELVFPTRVFFWANRAQMELHEGRNGNISARLSDEDSAKVKELLTGYWSYYDSPACGFSDEIYLQFGNAKFLLGMDDCGTVQTGNKYFTLSETDNRELHTILAKYKVSWPLF